ncbi:alphaN-acetylglucosamine transferase [Tothia fuscella]|uniref:AlphaN-acetylglucosamine transferase n=1 Tax=Tothia fuscella TaxID=1048955 RepID=A0A9P4U353_9PEZI|nr:alphaN-acetylglucosamine transferase [Tothia fuscella]
MTGFPVISKPSPYGYIFYATADDYACAVLLNIKRLRHLFHTRHQIHVLVAPNVGRSYIEAFESFQAIVTVREPPSLGPGSIPYYDGCLLKLIAFRMHEIESSLRRVLVLDADQLILRSLDSLFELPDVDLAAPRAYWIGRHAFASTLMLITLSDRLWQQVNEAMRTIKGNVYDMDLLNQLFDETVLMLPGSYITLNSHFEDWNMPSFYRPQDKDRKINLTAYVLHYTAIGKPWMHTVKEIKQLKPQAHPALYEQFELWRTEAKKICPRARMVVPADDELGFPEDEFWADVVDIV